MSRLLRTSAIALVIAILFSGGHPQRGQQPGSPLQADLQSYVQSTRLAQASNLTKFSFGVYSDLHMIESSDWGLTRTQWQGLLRQWRDAGHSFGVIVGDLGYGN